MSQSVLSNLAIILLAHLCINMISHYKSKLTNVIEKIFIIIIGSCAIIIMFYLPIKYGDFFLDFRLIPLLFLSFIRGWKIAIPVLLIASSWRFMMGGPGMFPSILFGMVLPTVVGLCFYKKGRPAYEFKRAFIATSIAWLFSDIPTIFYFQLSSQEITKFLFMRYLSITSASFILYVFLINALKQQNLTRKLNYLADYDQLTGLFNKRKFFDMVDVKLNNHKNSYFLAVLDLDFFKEINDKYGHLTGDKVLIGFANLLKEKQGENAVFARFGGEEFLALYSGNSMRDAVVFFEEIRMKLQHTTFFSVSNDISFNITVSVGLKRFIQTEEIEKQINKTDSYLYQAKSQGRNKICYEEE